MRGTCIILTVALLIAASLAAWSQTVAPYTPAELDEMLGPIALYPDPLLAQVLPAATYPDQLEAAQQLVGYEGGSGMIDDQAWDVSVKAVAHYPDVLKMMATSPDWTTAIGQAYVNQPDAVMSSIQRLRGKARLMGYLSSNSQQVVTTSNGYITIVPAQAQYIYVPTYNPGVVYVQRRSSYTSSIFAFGAGLLIGAWLNNAIDWNHHRVYYHGWNGGGWIGRSRPHVRVNNQYYVNKAWGNRAAPINRNIRTRDISGYRRDIQRNTGKYAPPGLIAPRPGVPTTRPARPGVRPNVPTARPGRPGVPTTRPGGIKPRPVAPITPRVPSVKPAIPGTGPGAPTARPARPGVPTTRHGKPGVPTTKPGRAVPHPATPAVPGTSTTRAGKRPSVAAPRPTMPTTPGASSTRSNRRPSVATPRPATRTTPSAPMVRPTPRPSAGAARPTPSARPNRGTVRTAPSSKPSGARSNPKPSNDKAGNGGGRG